MLNVGGAVEHFDVHKESEVPDEDKSGKATCILKVRGSGRFGVYSSECPLKCVVGGNETDLNYNSETGLTTLYIPVPEKDMYLWQIEIHF